MSNEFSWYAARLLFESVHYDHPADQAAAENDDPLFEEQVILVVSQSGLEDEALERALRLGEGASSEYVAIAGNLVKWRFVEVLDLKQLFDKELQEGSELYYNFLNQNEVTQLRNSLSWAAHGDRSLLWETERCAPY